MDGSDLVIICSFVVQLPDIDAATFDIIYPLQTLKPIASQLRSRVQSDVIDDDLNVAIMGGGYDDTDEATGSNLTIVNLDNLGKINKVIPLNNITNNNITNSAPSTPLVLTPDTVGDSNIYRGALVYLNDLEGKITKFNLFH